MEASKTEGLVGVAMHVLLAFLIWFHLVFAVPSFSIDVESPCAVIGAETKRSVSPLGVVEKLISILATLRALFCLCLKHKDFFWIYSELSI